MSKECFQAIFVVAAFLHIWQFCACTGKPGTNTEDFFEWLNDKEHGMIIEKRIDQLVFSAKYLPPAYFIATSGMEESLDLSFPFDSLLNNEKVYYLMFRISNVHSNVDPLKLGIRNQQEYIERVNYLSSGLQRDFWMLDGKDTLACSFLHFERSYGHTNYLTFMLGFEGRKTVNFDTDKVLLYYDNEFGSGPVKLRFDDQKLQKIPNLTIKYNDN